MSVDLQACWQAIFRQDAQGMRAFLHPEAEIRWHNTGGRFTAAEFVQVNCAYPGTWRGALQRVEQLGDLFICVACVWAAEGSPSLHAVSFLRVQDGLIREIDEYWGDDGEVPAWRQGMGLGRRLADLRNEAEQR